MSSIRPSSQSRALRSSEAPSTSHSHLCHCLFFYRNLPLIHQCNSYVRCRQWTMCSHLINPDPSVVQTALYSSLAFLSAVPKASTDSRSWMLSSSSQRQLRLLETAFCSALLPLKLQLLEFPRPRTDSTSVRRGISIL